MKKPDATVPVTFLAICGIYGWRRCDKYLYVGKSKDVFKRISNRHEKLRITTMDKSDEIDIWFCNENELDALEADLIQALRPVFNYHAQKQYAIKSTYKAFSGTFKEAFANKSKRKKTLDRRKTKEEDRNKKEDRNKRIDRENEEIDGWLAYKSTWLTR